MTSQCLHFRLFGNFAVTDSDGRDLTPSSKKAVGMLALLAQCDTMRRSRRWLEDKLWSDRGPAQAQGSLRSALHDARRSLGDNAAILQSDRSSVWLEREHVETDLDMAEPDREFLEGLDIGDQEFNDWLVQRRLEHARREPATPAVPADETRVSILCGTPWLGTQSRNVFAQVLDAQVGKIISDFIARSRCTAGESQPDIIVRTSVEKSAAGASVLAQVIDARGDDIIHSDHFFAEDLEKLVASQDAVGRFCWGVADIALERLQSLRDGAAPVAIRAQYSQEALRHVLSFEQSGMAASLALLDTACSQLRSGLFPAMKAWALMSMIMEGFVAEDRKTIEEIEALLRLASELSPDTGMVISSTI